MEKEAEEMDPDYKFFLNHLRPHGTSYLLQVNSPDHRHPIRINYEEEEEEEEEAEEEERGEEDGRVGSEVAEADASWRNFLRHLRRKRDGSLVLELESGVVLQYGEPEQQGQEQEDEGSANENRGPKHVKQASCSSSSTPRRNHRDHVLQSSNTNRCAPPPPQKPTRRSSGTKDSDFTKELIKELERPFNRAEYDKLMKLANASKPVVKFKHLRGDDIPYESHTMGNSYFDYYPDLARKVKHADHCEGLNLLRGLFFWLKNIELEGSYRPWAPKSSHRRTIPSRSYELLA